jgi:hypothetical protein
MAMALSAGQAVAAPPSTAEKQLRVDAHVGLEGLVATTELYFGRVAEALQVAASTDVARTARWEVVEPLLASIKARSIPALFWFALPDGSYWSAGQGKASGNLADRSYFPAVLAGEVVLGSLVYSKATGRASGIVAVPVVRAGAVVGVLGASVFLEQLTELIGAQLKIEPPLLFFAVDATPLIALEWKTDFILEDPTRLGSGSLARAVGQMLAAEAGSISFHFRNRQRSLYFRRSERLGWWFAFGVVHGGAGAR